MPCATTIKESSGGGGACGNPRRISRQTTKPRQPTDHTASRPIRSETWPSTICPGTATRVTSPSAHAARDATKPISSRYFVWCTCTAYLHETELTGAEKTAGRLVERQRDGQIVGAAQDLVERLQPAEQREPVSARSQRRRVESRTRSCRRRAPVEPARARFARTRECPASCRPAPPTAVTASGPRPP